MIKPIKTRELKVGMHVILTVGWLKHPFLRNHFTITSVKQIRELIENGFEKVQIDTSGEISAAQEVSESPIKSAQVTQKRWDPDKLIPIELKEAMQDKTFPPEKKVRIVYKCSLKIVDRLFEDPREENIREAKKAFADVVDLVISNDKTSDYLLRMISHDSYTYTHSVNVGVLSVLLSKILYKGSDAHNMHELAAGFFLHDIGKVRVDPSIINKPGRLTDEEMKQMRTHAYAGYEILSETKQLSEESKIIVLQHHERFDGTGYPFSLKGDEIHMYGRICSIADVYDALTSERSYKQKLGTFEALKVMKKEMINHFQKELFENFVLLFVCHR
ncbi:MAG: HD-GYP domain-containing protein [Thermodesulfovibrionales bacterium]|jgi:HD-GYP domain-containing protein (c-di-GMP phosphodiesterase class II)